jgi:hypothetical protein
MERKRILFTVCLALVLTATSAVPLPVFALGETQVTLSCSDGTEVDLTVDGQTLADLKDAVEAMTLYPAGLSCSLTEIPLLGAFGAGVARAANGPKDFAVGGGQIILGTCVQNFAINAHAPDDETSADTANGTINLTQPDRPGCVQGQFVAKTDCLDIAVDGNTAEFTAEVTKSTGFFVAFATPPNEVAFEVIDGDPSASDMIGGNNTSSDCNFTGSAPFTAINGNILVKDN